MSKLHLAKGLELPPSAVTQTFAFMGKRGPSSSTVRNYLSFLRVSGLIAAQGARIALTDRGRAEVGPVERPRSTTELLELWCPKLGSGPEKILRLRLLVERHPTPLGKDQIEHATGYSATSSTMRNYVSKLRSNGLLVKDGDGYRASPTLFPEVRQ